MKQSEFFKDYYCCIEAAIHSETIRSVLISMINNDPEYLYLQDIPKDQRILHYLKATMQSGILFDDFMYVIQECNIQTPQLLYMSVETQRDDISAHFIYHNKDYYLHKDYKADVDLILCAVEHNPLIVNELIFDNDIDIWNPPENIDKREHFSHIWRKVISGLDTECYHDKIDFIEFFINYGADVNMWFYGYGWMYEDDHNPENYFYYSPLTYAIGSNQFEIAKYLISCGAYVNDPIFPSMLASVKYGLNPSLQGTMTNIYNDLGFFDNKELMMTQFKGVLYMRRNLLFVIQHGANPKATNDKGQDVYQYIDDIMQFDIQKYIGSLNIPEEPEKSAKFREWHPEEVIRIKDITRTAIDDALDILKSNKKIVARSMDVVMKLMVMSEQIRSNQILSGNILSIIMDFHGGLGDELNLQDLRELEILLEKRQFLLSNKKHYEKLGFLEKKGGILHQKEGNLGQKKCDLPAIDVRNEQNMGGCTEEVCKNVQKTIKNSTFLNNLDTDSISMIEAHLNMQHHNVRSVAFNTMSAMLDDTLIAQAEWYVREGRALNTFAAAVANGDVTVISGPSTISEAIRIAEIAVSPDSDANLGREATSHIAVIDEAPNDDIIVHSDDILSQAMDLIHSLHFDTSLTAL